jgi:hypothetical protein
VWCDDPQEDPVISVFAGCLANHDRAHSHLLLRFRAFAVYLLSPMCVCVCVCVCYVCVRLRVRVCVVWVTRGCVITFTFFSLSSFLRPEQRQYLYFCKGEDHCCSRIQLQQP